MSCTSCVVHPTCELFADLGVEHRAVIENLDKSAIEAELQKLIKQGESS